MEHLDSTLPTFVRATWRLENAVKMPFVGVGWWLRALAVVLVLRWSIIAAFQGRV